MNSGTFWAMVAAIAAVVGLPLMLLGTGVAAIGVSEQAKANVIAEQAKAAADEQANRDRQHAWELQQQQLEAKKPRLERVDSWLLTNGSIRCVVRNAGEQSAALADVHLKVIPMGIKGGTGAAPTNKSAFDLEPVVVNFNDPNSWKVMFDNVKRLAGGDIIVFDVAVGFAVPDSEIHLTYDGTCVQIGSIWTSARNGLPRLDEPFGRPNAPVFDGGSSSEFNRTPTIGDPFNSPPVPAPDLQLFNRIDNIKRTRLVATTEDQLPVQVNYRSSIVDFGSLPLNDLDLEASHQEVEQACHQAEGDDCVHQAQAAKNNLESPLQSSTHASLS